MKKILCYAALLLLVSCNKPIDELKQQSSPTNNKSAFTKYVIKKGEHFCNVNVYKPVELSELKFAVRFDSSAIYTSKISLNQHDINKLYGFSDNGAKHHEYSARFGWSWTHEALHLHAYVYNDGKRVMADLGPIAIGKETECSIKVKNESYIFQVGDRIVTIERSSKTHIAKGYMLYPYFGGDETAPHDVSINIKNL